MSMIDYKLINQWKNLDIELILTVYQEKVSLFMPRKIRGYRIYVGLLFLRIKLG